MEDLRVWLGYDNIFTVNPVNTWGALALFWKNSIDLEILYADKNLLDVYIKMGDQCYFLSCIYGHPHIKFRHLVWERLMRFSAHRKGSWCMVGDFNEILNNSEKIGGPIRSDSSFDAFSDMLHICNMTELPSTGNSFTWGGRRSKLWIQSKLDRAFGNSDWFKTFPASNQSFLAKRGSDHRPVLVKFLASQDNYRGSFRFDKRFLHKPLVQETIHQAWNLRRNNLHYSVSMRLSNCRKALSQWKKQSQANSKERITVLQNDLETEQSSMDPSSMRCEFLRRELLKAYRDEENFWKQKSKDDWILHGDGNTKIFHAAVKTSRAKNEVSKLIDVHGITHRSEASKAQVAISYFQELFKSSNIEDYPDILRGLPAKVSERMNISLIKPITPDEVKNAVFSIKPESAPGVDGMTGFFFQNLLEHNWGAIHKRSYWFF